MKKIFAMLFIVVLGLSLVACKKGTYEVDGVFTAIEFGDNYGTPMLTWADVTVKDGEIESIFIDALQASVNEEGVFTWNAKTKKELGYDYRMHDGGRTKTDEEYKAFLTENNLLEWFEQAKLIEDEFLANGVGDKIDGITGVTIADGGYTTVVKKAIENAKNLVFVDFEYNLNYGAPQVVWSEVTVNKKGEVTKVFLDTIQSTKTVAEEKTSFSWNDKSKKELGYDYRMHDGGRTKTDEEYKAFLTENDLLEWFEQAKLVEDFFLANGAKDVDNVSGVTITTDSYTLVVKRAIAKISK
ncbi:MAG TPA: FMN-binding protein [Acholeplasmataceae bacterium]|nr:FMN-binding protein [Acholeplasmataceae bacterium]